MAITDGDWIKIDYSRERQAMELARQKSKMNRTLVMSPYDIPEFLRFVELEDDWLRIEFRYIDGTENSEVFHFPDGSRACLGKATKRLLAVEMKPQKHDIANLIRSSIALIKQLADRKDLQPQVNWNYKAATSALDQNIDRFTQRFSGFFPKAVHG